MTNGEFLQNKANKFIESVLENIPFKKNTIHEFVFLGYSISFEMYLDIWYTNTVEFITTVNPNAAKATFTVNFDDLHNEYFANELQKSVINAILFVHHKNI